MISATLFGLAVVIVTIFVAVRDNEVKEYGAVATWIFHVFNSVLAVSAVLCLASLLGYCVNFFIVDREHVNAENYEFLLFIFLALAMATIAGGLTLLVVGTALSTGPQRSSRAKFEQVLAWWLFLHGATTVATGLAAAWWDLQNPQAARFGGLGFTLMAVGTIVFAAGAAQFLLVLAWDGVSPYFRKR